MERLNHREILSQIIFDGKSIPEESEVIADGKILIIPTSIDFNYSKKKSFQEWKKIKLIIFNDRIINVENNRKSYLMLEYFFERIKTSPKISNSKIKKILNFIKNFQIEKSKLEKFVSRLVNITKEYEMKIIMN